MTISGLVLNLSSDPASRESALERLRADPRLELGTAIGHRLPIVTEAPTIRDARQLYEEIVSVPGVDFVDLVYAEFSETEPSSSSTADTTQNPTGTIPR